MFWRLNYLVAAANSLVEIVVAMSLCKSDCPVWTGCSVGQCPAEVLLQAKLRDIFGHQSFRPGQLEALLPVAHGKDVFVHIATGGGKSLCMYLVPLCISNEAVGIVISPLVGLVEQQVSSMLAL